MKKFRSFLLVTSIGALIIGCEQPASDATDKTPEKSMITYPVSKKDAVIDNYFGTDVADPYRWLEDDNAQETLEWVDAQNKVTQGYLTKISSREKIESRLTELLDYEKVSAPRKVGEYFFVYKNSGLQNQSVIYIKKGVDGEEEVFLDPNTINKEGTSSISLMGASKDDKYIAVSRSDAGSDWSEIHVYDIATKKQMPDEMKWVKFSGAAWWKDGFFYSRYPAPKDGDELSAVNTSHNVYYHKMGTDQSDDQLVYSNPSAPNMYHNASVTEDDKYLMIYAATGTDGYELMYDDLSKPGFDFVKLFSGFENKSSVVHHENGLFYVMTDIDAPNYRLVTVDPNKPEKPNWKEIIPENENLLQGASTAGGVLFSNYLEKANTKIYRYAMDGSGKEQVQLPDNTGSAGGFGGKMDDEKLYYYFSSFTYPTTIYEYDIQSGKSELFSQPKLKFDPSAFESKQVTYKSKDGTDVNMFLVYKKGLKLDGKRPTMLYGYGGFNVSLTPSFSTSNIVLLENGGVYAMANLRGGGVFGEEWHQGGMLHNKQNVFDDFIAAGEYLIAEGYTSSDHLAIAGGSNGGLLVGAAMAQRPDLFAVAFPAVGVMDMLRYHRFTVGWGWIPEYGSADSTKADFDNLRAYSPLHNLTDGTAYPATMVTTADHDDRVVPAHSFKFAARLQAAHKGANPVLIRIEKSAGHGAGKPMSKVIEEQADKWAFLFENTGVGYLED